MKVKIMKNYIKKKINMIPEIVAARPNCKIIVQWQAVIILG